MPPSPRRSFSYNSDVTAELIRKKPCAVTDPHVGIKVMQTKSGPGVTPGGSATSTKRVRQRKHTPVCANHTSFARLEEAIDFSVRQTLGGCATAVLGQCKDAESAYPTRPPYRRSPREMRGGAPGKRSGFASCFYCSRLEYEVPPTRSDSNTCPFDPATWRNLRTKPAKPGVKNFKFPIPESQALPRL